LRRDFDRLFALAEAALNERQHCIEWLRREANSYEQEGQRLFAIAVRMLADDMEHGAHLNPKAKAHTVAKA